MPGKICVVIPSYRSAGDLGRCLQAIDRARDAQVAVIVVDSSGDGAARAVCAEHPWVRLIATPSRLYPGAARNVGISAADPDCILAFVDTQLEIPGDWFEQIRAWFENSDAPALGGARILHDHATLPEVVQFLVEFNEFLPEMPAQRKRAVPAGNSAYRPGVLGPDFDPSLRTVEDWALGYTMDGERFQFEPRLSATYHGKQSWQEMWRHLEQLGAWSAHVRRRFDLPGAWIARSGKLAAPLVGPYRLARFYGRVAAHAPGRLPHYMSLLGPLCLGFAAWTWGFARTAWSGGARVTD